MERRPPSHTSLKVKDLTLSTHRAAQGCFLRTFPGRHGLEHSFLKQSAHSAQCAECADCLEWCGQGHGLQTTCRKAESLRRPITVSSRRRGLGALRAHAIAGDAGGMGELGCVPGCPWNRPWRHAHALDGVDWARRRKSFFRIRPRLKQLEMEPTFFTPGDPGRGGGGATPDHALGPQQHRPPPTAPVGAP